MPHLWAVSSTPRLPSHHEHDGIGFRAHSLPAGTVPSLTVTRLTYVGGSCGAEALTMREKAPPLAASVEKRSGVRWKHSSVTPSRGFDGSSLHRRSE
jgi:hypothetical protein